MPEGKDNEVYLRMLSYAEKQRFKRGLEKIAIRIQALATVTAEDKLTEIWDDDIEHADYYLIVHSMCYPDGALIWKDQMGKYNAFRESAGSKVLEEIIFHIVKFSHLDGTFNPEREIEESKKKLES